MTSKQVAPSWASLNERQRQYMQAIYETDQEQEADERGAWKRGGSPRPASLWRWQEYGVFDGVGSTLYMKLYLRKLVDEGTGSTFNALEARRFIRCKYTYKRRDGDREAMERFLMLQITKDGRALVRSATGAKAYRPGAPGTLREWHWKAMVEAWKSRPAGVESVNGYYGHIGWNTWCRLTDKFAKEGIYASEKETGDFMCQYAIGAFHGKPSAEICLPLRCENARQERFLLFSHPVTIML